MNFAPRMPTILVALVLVVIGLAGTFGAMLPAFAGLSGAAIGAWAFVLAAVLLLIGMLFEGI